MRRLFFSFAFLLPLTATAQTTNDARAIECPSCAAWNAPHAPARIHGNTWYVGTRGLSAILITSTDGHILIDAGLPESAPLIIENIRRLGFRVEDVRIILNSHAHFDHAGGIAAIQQRSRAEIVAHPWSAAVIRTGKALPEDPQLHESLVFPAASNVRSLADRDTIRVGTVRLIAHFTGGHTPGGTTWSWRSCDGADCIDLVYADSQTAISDDTFLFTDNTRYPSAIADFERGFLRLEQLPCDLVLTPHPGVSGMLEWIGKTAPRRADNGTSPCRAFAANARQRLNERIAKERSR